MTRRRRAKASSRRDYTKYPEAGALKGARIGVARDFIGADPDVDWVIESVDRRDEAAGATVVDVRYPKWLLDARGEFYNAVRWPEFPPQIAEYLATLGPKYPKNIDEMIARAKQFTSPRAEARDRTRAAWALFKREAESGTIDRLPSYSAVHDHMLPAIRAVVDGMLASQTARCDRLSDFVDAGRGSIAAPGARRARPTPSATNIANLTGFPDLIVPAGFTSDRLPVDISFFGPAFSEPKLLALGYAFEQATKARRRPVNTPLLPGETIVLK